MKENPSTSGNWKNQKILFIIRTIMHFIKDANIKNLSLENCATISEQELHGIYNSAMFYTQSLSSTYTQRKSAEHFLEQVGAKSNFLELSKYIVKPSLPNTKIDSTKLLDGVEPTEVFIMNKKDRHRLIIETYGPETLN